MRIPDCAAEDMSYPMRGVFCFATVFILTTANAASSVHDEGNACFDMAAAIPNLESVTGNRLFSISIYRLTHLFSR